MNKRTLKIAAILAVSSIAWLEFSVAAPIQSRAEYLRKKAEVIEWEMDHCTDARRLQRLEKQHARIIARKRKLSAKAIKK